MHAGFSPQLMYSWGAGGGSDVRSFACVDRGGKPLTGVTRQPFMLQLRRK
jgi:hypothetical protein